MPHIMAQFQKRYPSISFQILVSDSRDIVEKVSRHELLMGAVGAKTTNTQINYTPFMDDELIVVSAPSLIKKKI